ncbi:hypothetical protein KKF69_05400 [Patescibacteria group bacterium]|nr:hypothetical protein [Patescibacteria group bacterium]
MKSFIALFFVFVAEFFLLPSLFFVFAADPCPAGFESLCFNFTEKPNIIGNIVQVLIIIAIILSVIFLIWGGIRWIMSGGDKGKVEQARSVIIAAIAGLVISFLAYFIVSVVGTMFINGFDLKNINIPRLID